MPWTALTDRSTAYTVTAADWNIVEDNLTYLYGDTGWTGAAGVVLSNSWVDFGAPSAFGFRKIGTRVELRGALKSGTLNTVAFTLPAGYRPTQSLNLACVSNSAFGYLAIASTGAATIVNGSNVWFSFDGVSFDTI